jgi:hypothetical protein
MTCSNSCSQDETGVNVAADYLHIFHFVSSGMSVMLSGIWICFMQSGTVLQVSTAVFWQNAPAAWAWR